MHPLLARPCPTPDALHAWVRLFCGIDVPRVPVCDGHDAPFDYLCRAYFEPAADLVVWAPRGGGKTRLAAVATLLDLLHKPGCRVRILGGSLEQSLKMWEHLLPDVARLAGGAVRSRLSDASRRIRLANGSDAAVLTQSQRAVRGLRVQKIRCDEVELFDPAIWEAAQLATRSIPRTLPRHLTPQRAGPTPPRQGRISAASAAASDAAVAAGAEPPLVRGSIEAISTLHADGGLMGRIVDQASERGVRVLRWCLLDVLERCPPERSCAGCPLWDDCGGVAKTRCSGFVSIDDAIRMKQRSSDEAWQSEMLCRRPSTRGRVFPAFDEERHVREWDGRCVRMHLGMDFGFASPFVAVWVAELGDGRWHVIDEYARAGRTLPEHIAAIRSRQLPRALRVGCDPAGAAGNAQTASSDVQLLRRAGFVVRHRSTRIAQGLELIRRLLSPASGEPRLHIDPRCAGLITAMRHYRYPPAGGEAPLKDGTHDHYVDALRYHFVNAPEMAMRGRGY